MADVPSEAQVRRSRHRLLLACALLGIPGLVVSFLTRNEVQIAGSFVFGCAVTVLIARAFYEVGISEDRARAENRH